MAAVTRLQNSNPSGFLVSSTGKSIVEFFCGSRLSKFSCTQVFFHARIFQISPLVQFSSIPVPKQAMQQWIGRLGSLHQYKGVPYVDVFDDGDVQCNLCGTGYMSNAARVSHFHGDRHLRNYRAVQNLERERDQMQRKKDLLAYRCSIAANYDYRVKQLGYRQWQDAVFSSMYRFIQHGTDILPRPTEALSILERYERMEVLSLLELAIVKAKICDGVFFQTLEDLRDQHVLSDGTFDSSSFIHAQRIQSGCQVIIPNVASFL